MKSVLVVLGLVAVSLGMVAGAVFGLGDETLLTSSPEYVAKQFVESLAYGRAAPARHQLTDEAQRATSVEDLLRISTQLRRRFGAVAHVETIAENRRGDTISVEADVKGSRTGGKLRVLTVHQHGEWAIAEPGTLVR